MLDADDVVRYEGSNGSSDEDEEDDDFDSEDSGTEVQACNGLDC